MNHKQEQCGQWDSHESPGFKCFELQVIVVMSNTQWSVTRKMLAPESELIGLIFHTKYYLIGNTYLILNIF